MKLFVFGWCPHIQGGMALCVVMERVYVIGHCGTELENRYPLFLVQQFGLHPAPEGFDHGIVIAIPDRSEA